LIQQFTGSFGGRIALLFTEEFSACNRMEAELQRKETAAASTHSPLPFQGEASVGSSSARHVANAAAGRSKHAAREISNQKRSTGHASEAFYAQDKGPRI